MHFLQQFKYIFCKEHDPQWLEEGAKPYREEYPWLETAFSEYTRAKDGGIEVYFVDSFYPNKPGPDWQSKECIVLDNSNQCHLTSWVD